MHCVILPATKVLFEYFDQHALGHEYILIFYLTLFAKFTYFIPVIALYFFSLGNKWDKVFKNGPSKICWGRPYYFNFFKGCLPQILLGPFWNTLSQILTYLITFWTFMQQFLKKFRDFSTIYCFFPPQVHWKCFQVTVSFCHRLCTQ